MLNSPSPLLSTSYIPDEHHDPSATDRALRVPLIVHAILTWAITGAGYQDVPSERHQIPAFPKFNGESMVNAFMDTLARDRNLENLRPKKDVVSRRQIQAVWRYALVNRVWLDEALRFMW